MNKNQKGFAVFETLLLIIIVAIIGGVGWYALHTKHQTDKILSQADKISQSTPVLKNNNGTNKPESSNTSSTVSNVELIATAVADKCHSNNKSLDTSKVKAANISLFNSNNSNLIVDGNYAGVNGTCGESVEPGGGIGFLFKKTNGSWTFIYEGQQQPDCEAVDNQGWPVSVLKTFEGTCYDSATQSYREPK